MEWQPISTAPKDGTEILLCRNGARFIGHWDKVYGWLDQFDMMRDPTTWQPLPRPPNASTGRSDT